MSVMWQMATRYSLCNIGVLSAMSRKNQHVVPHKDGWAVKGEGNQRATSTHSTQQQAIDAARGIAKNQQSEILVHGRNGQIRERDSYGHDPFPPKG